jgi:aryl carrier-like protein
MGLAKLGLPLVQVIDQLTKAPEALDLQALVNQLLDSLRMMAGTNGLLNQTRRDMICTQFAGHTTAVFGDHPLIESGLLLGDDLGDRVKMVSQTSGLKLA